MKSTTKYQVCTIDKAAKTAQVLETIQAVDLSDAVEIANGKYPRAAVRVYPLVTLDDPDSITSMAAFTLASYENWERRNNFAALNPHNRSQWDREDYISIATIAIISTLTDSPNATMYTVKSAAFSAISTEQARRDRRREREYNPGWTMCNVTPRITRATCSELDRLIRNAGKQANLTAGQMEALTLRFGDGLSVIEIAERTNRTREGVYTSLYRAYYWVLKKAAELDGAELPTFKLAGYTAEDIAETITTLRKRGRMNKDQK